MRSLISLHNVSKTYLRGQTEVVALEDVTLQVKQGTFLAIIGPSGSGKSTLLSLIGCLDRPTKGSYDLDGISVGDLNDQELSQIRNRRMGFVFQSFHLIPELTVQENVETPLLYSDVPLPEWSVRARHCLEKVSLENRAHHRPGELSGGEAQRAAIARALVMNPSILLADEPTGNLDTKSGSEIAELMTTLHQEGGTVILVTHNEELAHRAHRLLRFRDGRLECDEVLVSPARKEST